MTVTRAPRPRRPLRALFASFVAAAVVATGLVVAGPAPVALADSAPADPGLDPTVTADPLPTVQINGVAWQQVVVGDTVYVAGEFSSARPAGAPRGTGETPRANLLAYSLSTGELLPWAPTLDAAAYSIAASPDGTRIYVGGDFTRVNGAARNRFTALTASTGALVSGFTGGANATVRTIAASATEIYIGGNFNTVAGQDRPRLASFTSSGALRSWRVSAQSAQVESIVLSPDRTRLIVGGRFDRLNGVYVYGSGAVSTSNGSVQRWDANQLITNYGYDAGVMGLSTDGQLIYGTAFAFLTSGQGYGNLEGAFAANPSTGEIQWLQDCHGDTYSSYGNPGKDHIFVAGHPYFCANIHGFPETSGRFHHYSLAFTKSAETVITRNSYGGYFNFEGTPAPALRNHYPDFTTGTFTGQDQAGWHVTGSGDYVLYGGEFLAINGVAQEGLVRFATADKAPNDEGPRITSSSQLQPTAASNAAGTIQVSWPSNWDRDNENLTYRVIRDGNTANPVHAVTRPARFWQLPRMSFTDTGLVNGRSYSYRVQAVDPFGNTVTSPSVSATVRSTGSLSAYAERVLDDTPSAYFRMGDTSGGFANWTSHSAAAAGNAVTRGVPGAIAGDTDRAARFTGSSSSRVYATARDYAQARWAQNMLTVEAWFRTTSTAGGKIVGLGSTTGTGNSSNYDRHVYMTADGRLVFGAYPNRVAAISSPGSYNDGDWHHVVGTLDISGLRLFVDGTQVAHDPTVASGQQYNGVWRIGGDTLGSWPDAAGQNFVGDIDEVAIYGRALSAQDIQIHYGLGTTGSVPNLPPTASFTVTGGELTASANASASDDPDGSIASYAWQWGDGGTGSGETATHAYAAGGTYTVTLTVTDDDGATATTTRDVVVTAPNQPPTASFSATVTDLGVAVDASLSDDPDGDIASYAWAFGDGATGTGVTANHTYAAADTFTITLTVTDADGATDSTTREVTTTEPTTGYLGLDTFGRTVSSGWGSAEVGGAWITTAGVASVSGGQGVLTLPGANASAAARLPGAAGTDMLTRVTTTLDRRPNGSGAWGLVRNRITDGGEYRLKLNYRSNGTVTAWFVRTNSSGTETAITSATTVSGLTYSAGTAVRAAFEVVGTSPTTLRARVWGGSQAEPTTWPLTTTDSTAALQTAGHAGLAMFLSSSTTNGPVTVRVDDFSVFGPGGVQPPPPGNEAPTASFTDSVDGLTVQVDGSGSSDPEGAVASYAWDFGDGATGTGATASRTYAEAGTYPVTLTVTDGEGATGQVTRSVTVTAPDPDPEPGEVLASDAFGRTVASGWGDADAGGTWLTSAGTSVNGSAGVLTLASAGSSQGARLPDAVGTDVTTRVETALDRRPNSSGAWTLLRGRITDGGEYRLKTSWRSNGTLTAWLVRTNATGSETAITSSVVVSGLTYTAGTLVTSLIEVTGTSPTTVRGKVWLTGAAEPSSWLVETTDATAALQGPGSTGVAAIVSGGTTNIPVTVTLDDFLATSPDAVAPIADAEDPVNEPPTAAFTVDATDLTVQVDGSGSVDDGSIASYAWTFGDGGTATGPTASHTYAAAGTYTITLTVTDDEGATGTATRDVTLLAPVGEPPGEEPPAEPVVVAADEFQRVVIDGFGDADTGGTWLTTAGVASVSDGIGKLTLAGRGSVASARLPGVEGVDQTSEVTLTLDRRPTGGGGFALLRGRITTGGEYRLKLGLAADGTVTAWFVRSNASGTETALTSAVAVPGLTYDAGTTLRLRLEVTGTSPTRLRAQVWDPAGTEPTTWLIETTDATAALQGPGHAGLAALLSSWAGTDTVVAGFDTFRVIHPE